MPVFEQVRDILGEVLQLDERTADLSADTALLGNLPEFDSMAVVAVITALEEAYEFEAEDDEIEAELFATVGSLVEFVTAKLAA